MFNFVASILKVNVNDLLLVLLYLNATVIVQTYGNGYQIVFVTYVAIYQVLPLSIHVHTVKDGVLLYQQFIRKLIAMLLYVIHNSL